jgi:hypothetical protein
MDNGTAHLYELCLNLVHDLEEAAEVPDENPRYIAKLRDLLESTLETLNVCLDETAALQEGNHDTTRIE